MKGIRAALLGEATVHEGALLGALQDTDVIVHELNPDLRLDLVVLTYGDRALLELLSTWGTPLVVVIAASPDAVFDGRVDAVWLTPLDVDEVRCVLQRARMNGSSTHSALPGALESILSAQRARCDALRAQLRVERDAFRSLAVPPVMTYGATTLEVGGEAAFLSALRHEERRAHRDGTRALALRVSGTQASRWREEMRAYDTALVRDEGDTWLLFGGASDSLVARASEELGNATIVLPGDDVVAKLASWR